MIIISARMGSHRFPGKVLADLCGRPVLQHVIDRCLETGHPVGLAIPRHDEDLDYRFHASVPIYRHGGDENDVLSRYYHAAKWWGAGVVARVTGDCPLIDPETINAVVNRREGQQADYCANEPYISGLGMEVFTMEALEEAYAQSTEREHVTTYIRTLPKQARLHDVERPVNLSIDTPEDLERVRQIMADLGVDCRTKEIVEWIDRRAS